HRRDHVTVLPRRRVRVHDGEEVGILAIRVARPHEEVRLEWRLVAPAPARREENQEREPDPPAPRPPTHGAPLYNSSYRPVHSAAPPRRIGPSGQNGTPRPPHSGGDRGRGRSASWSRAAAFNPAVARARRNAKRRPRPRSPRTDATTTAP